MNSSVIIPIIISLVIPSYWLWRSFAAINARGLLAGEVDSYLGNEENPEELKLLVYYAFKDSMKNFLVFEILYFFLFNSQKTTVKTFSVLQEQFGKEKFDETIQIVGKLVVTNIKLSPVSYMLFGLIFIFVGVYRILLDSASSLSFVNSLRAQAEKAILTAVH